MDLSDLGELQGVVSELNDDLGAAVHTFGLLESVAPGAAQSWEKDKKEGYERERALPRNYRHPRVLGPHPRELQGARVDEKAKARK